MKWSRGRHYENSEISWRFFFIIRGVSETIQNEGKKQKGGFPSMLLFTLGASLLGNIYDQMEDIMEIGKSLEDFFY